MASPFVLVMATGSSEIDAHIALKFAPLYPIALICDIQDNLEQVVRDVEGIGGEAVIFEADFSTSSNSLSESIKAVTKRFGSECAVAIFQMRSLRSPPRQTFLEQTSIHVRKTVVSSITSAHAFAQQTLPFLLTHANHTCYPPTLIFAGSNGKSTFDEVRDNPVVALSRSLGREFGKKGVHISHVKFKKDLNTSLSREPGSGDTKPAAIAATFWYLHMQPLSCFSNEITI